jgi:Concanavalin A-like lectin/glucanases superfamily/SprB repeat/Secretion system C-terminal sorting domain/WD40-like Beta Propeller Repeat
MKQYFTLSFLKLRFIGLMLITTILSPALYSQNFVFSKTVNGKDVIYTANWNFSAIKQLTNPDTSCIDPQVSPDGKHIAFFKGEKGSDFGLWVMNTDGTGAKRLTYDVLVYGSHPSWHPNGKMILYEAESKTDISESYIRIIDIDGKYARNLFNNAKDLDRFPCMNPADSNQVVYHYEQGTWPYFSQVRIRSLFDGTDKLVVDNNGWADGYFSFSSDGKMILWSETENGDEMRLRTINLENGVINTINTVRGPYKNIIGTLDQTGKIIFYIRRSATQATEVVRCNADGSAPVVLYTDNNINRLDVIPGIPVGVYIFDGNAIDVSGYGNDATVNNAALFFYRCGRADNAYLFSGFNSYVSVPHSEIYNFGEGDFSILAIVSSPGIYPGRSALVNNHSTETLSDNGLFLGLENGIPFMELSSGDGLIERVNGSSNICNNEYRAVCGVRENGVLKLYVDFKLQDTVLSTINLDNSNPVTFGGNSYTNGSSEYFNGNIDDVWIYSRALSAGEIISIFNECFPQTYLDIYPCDRCDLTVDWLAPAIDHPCGLTKPFIKIRIINVGHSSAEDFTVKYSIDNRNTFVYEHVNAEILPGASMEYTFRQPADMSVIKTYYCSAEANKSGDTFSSNDATNVVVVNKRRELVVETAESVCAQATGGAIVTEVTNGIPPYSYSWSNGSTSDRADTLAVGFYNVSVTDSKGCSASASFAIDELGAPKIASNVSIKNNSCFDVPDGSIGITVIGGNIPYTYEWSNGMITEDIDGLTPGHYELIITDKNGCKKFADFDVSEPAPLYLSMYSSNSSVTGNDGTAEIAVYGGTPPYAYKWSTGIRDSSITDLDSGYYQVVVTDANGCQDSAQAVIFKLCGPDIVVNSVSPSECGSMNGRIDISIPGDDGPFEYLWSTGDTLQDLSGVASGKYVVTVAYKDSLCASVAEINVPAQLDPVPICMVSVDTATGHNMVVWQEPFYSGNISSFNIYRETERYEVYKLIGTRSINQESFYIDDDPVVNPAIQPWKYKLSVVDTCGNESDLSESHKTMHLLMNLGLGNTVNLIWDNYSGFDYYTCHIFRYSPEEGLKNIFNKAGSPQLIFNSFTDLTPPDSGYYYFIEIESPYTCTSQKKATSHNSVRSNTARKNTSTGVIFPELPLNLKELGLFPNPNNGTFNLTVRLERPDDIEIRIWDPYGRLLFNRETGFISGENEEAINIEGIAPGIYLLQVILNDGSVIRPFVIE